MSNERDELLNKNEELDAEITEYERQVLVEEENLYELNEQAKILSAEVDEKELELSQLDNEVTNAESAKLQRDNDL